jgi:filamentous hemagglutinin
MTTQAMMQLSPQYALDFASAGLYASQGDSNRATEHLIAGLTSRDYARDVALGVTVATVSAATAIKPEVVTIGENAGSIRIVNPGYPAAGRTQNCVNCSIATDATLSGNPAVSLPSNGPINISTLENLYGGRFGYAATNSEIEQQMLNAGNGARGIVFGSRGPSDAGHVFNVVNQNGKVRFLDGQTGAPATFDGYTSFHLLRTN